MENNGARIWLSITQSLIKSTVESYNQGNWDYYSNLHSEINKISTLVEKNYPDTYKFPQLSYKSYLGREDLMHSLSTLREIEAFLIAVSGFDLENIKSLKNKIKYQQDKLDRFDEKEAEYIEIIKNSRTKSDYSVDEYKLKMFSGNNLKLINEAIDAYSVGAYTACICVCRNILQKLIQQLCKENSIKGGSLESQITQLVDAKIITNKYHSQLIDVAKFFGHRAAHPTTEVFSKEKASLILSSLFIINEDLFHLEQK